MLVLSRKPGQEIVIGRDVVVRVLATRGKRVQIGISAPAAVSIQREEVHQHRDSSTRRARANGSVAGIHMDHDQPAE